MAARIEASELEYWGDVFVLNGLKHYMTFSCFMQAPAKYFQEITGREYRPLLLRQRLAAARIHQRFADLDAAIDEMEAQVEHLRRIQNGHCYEQLKHHANGR